ncbi:MAG: hypothetical protein HKN44_08495 [Ilumatobacter sp.]|nr:hypothetical protein [Ilumatobacter sp.]
MDLERDLADRLRAGASAVSAHADLDEVVAGASGRRRRTRRLSIGGAVAVVAIGVGGVFLVADRDRAPVDRSAAAQRAAVDSSPATASAPAATDAAAATSPEDLDAVGGQSVDVPLSTTPASAPPNGPSDGPDPADEYLDRTSEIYRRTLPSGDEVTVRLSDVAYGELFDIDWVAPTGSAELCVGHPAAMIGGPDLAGDWSSAWAVRQWLPLHVENETHVEELYFGDDSNFVVVRTILPAVEVGVSGPGIHADRAAFVGGIAILELNRDGELTSGDGAEGPMVTMVTDPAFAAAPDQLEFSLYAHIRQTPALFDPACQPPPPPSALLPPPGAQPADTAAAEAEIRARHALLVDQTVAPEDKPEWLLDDATGVTAAREQMEAGQYAESAAGAKYTLEEFVFTDPVTAWFRYSIDSPTGLFSNRLGQATFNGEVWQITRQTICQDLTLAAGYCDGDDNPTPSLSPFDEAELEALWRDWELESGLYRRALSCDPLVFCA